MTDIEKIFIKIRYVSEIELRILNPNLHDRNLQ